MVNEILKNKTLEQNLEKSPFISSSTAACSLANRTLLLRTGVGTTAAAYGGCDRNGL